MSNVLLTDKDDWLYLLLFPHAPPKKKKKLVLGQLMIADCLISFINPITGQTVCYLSLDTGHYRKEMHVILLRQC